MYKKLIIVGCSIAIGALTMTACEDDAAGDDSKVKKNISDKDSVKIEESDTVVFEDEGIDHRLPSPSLFFEVISEIGGDADMELINPVGDLSDLGSTSERALNFGVYFADLGYMFNYDSNAAMAEYLAALEQLANDMSISAVFSEDMLNKASENGDNADSIYVYQNDIYASAYSYLEEEGKQDILSYMLLGGWLESMHIVAGLAGEYSEDNPLIEKIAGQRAILESIMAHVEMSIELDSDLGDWYNNLFELQEIYNNSLESLNVTQEKNKKGRLVIAGGDEVKLNKETFGMIIEKVEEMRSSIVSTK